MIVFEIYFAQDANAKHFHVIKSSFLYHILVPIANASGFTLAVEVNCECLNLWRWLMPKKAKHKKYIQKHYILKMINLISFFIDTRLDWNHKHHSSLPLPLPWWHNKAILTREKLNRFYYGALQYTKPHLSYHSHNSKEKMKRNFKYIFRPYFLF